MRNEFDRLTQLLLNACGYFDGIYLSILVDLICMCGFLMLAFSKWKQFALLSLMSTKVSDRVECSLRTTVKYTIINALHLHKTALNLTRSKVNLIGFTRVVITSMSISRYINSSLLLRWLLKRSGLSKQ